ncbi:MAG: thermonuclease family protein [Tepidisphaeraceae bacterium]|jgi:endonuclease YncB( thermonuclease family)
MAARLRRRRWIGLARAAVLCAAVSILLDHVRAANRHGDDWSRFDRREVQFVAAHDGQSIDVRRSEGEAATAVHLLGVAAAGDPVWDQIAAQQLALMLSGKPILLQLEPTQTRDDRGRLLAYAFVDERQPINAQIVRQGWARADPQMKCALQGMVQQAQKEASKKQIGIWSKSAGDGRGK